MVGNGVPGISDNHWQSGVTWSHPNPSSKILQIPCEEVWKEPLKAVPQEVFRGPNIFSGGVWMSRGLMTEKAVGIFFSTTTSWDELLIVVVITKKDGTCGGNLLDMFLDILGDWVFEIR